MATFESKWSVLLAAAVLAACSASTPRADQGDDDPNKQPDSDRQVCPQCVAGGQTGDFGGASIACLLTEEPVTDEVAQKYRLAELRASVEGSFSVPMRWSVDATVADAVGDDSAYLALPSGYDDETSVEGRVTLEEPVFVASAPLGPYSICEGYVKFPAHVEVATTDGAVETITTHGELDVSVDRSAHLTTRAQLRDVRGSLDLHVNPSRPEYFPIPNMPLPDPGDTLDVFGYVFPDGLRGSIAPDMRGSVLISGRWPDDECEIYWEPANSDSEQVWLDGGSFTDLYASWRAEIESLGPTRGYWLDGSEVDVHVEFADLPKRGCMGGGPDFVFQTDSRLVTSDGRVMATFVSGQVSKDALWLWSSLPTMLGEAPHIDADEFADRTGITGVDAAGSPYLATNFDVLFDRVAGAIRIQGWLEVGGTPNCQTPDGVCAVDPQVLGASIDCLQWPWQVDFPENCGRQLR